MLKAAEWYSHHADKPIVVLSDSLAKTLGAADDNCDVAGALQALSLDATVQQPAACMCGSTRASCASPYWLLPTM